MATIDGYLNNWIPPAWGSRTLMTMSTGEKQDASFNAAKQLYAEQFGDAIVTNTYLKMALLAMALVSAGLIYANVRTVRMVQTFKPLVIRINDIGRAEAVKYDTLGYKPQDAEKRAMYCPRPAPFPVRSLLPARRKFHASRFP